MPPKKPPFGRSAPVVQPKVSWAPTRSADKLPTIEEAVRRKAIPALPEVEMVTEKMPDVLPNVQAPTDQSDRVMITETGVPSPLPVEKLQRVLPTVVEKSEVSPGYVPGTVVSVQGDTAEDPVEMIDGLVPKAVTPSVESQTVRFDASPSEWPVHLTAQALLKPSAGGAPNVQALRAPRCNWLRIDEIKFECLYLPSDNTDTAANSFLAMGFGAVVAVSLTLGGRPLTNGFVPISMFGPSRRLTGERLVFWEGLGGVARGEEYAWKLPVPIYVPPGGVLEPVFEHRGYLDVRTRARISYSGAVLSHAPPAADQAKLPFAASWTSSTMALVGGAPLPETFSTEKDLMGPLGADLNVTHLMGRLYFAIQNATYRTLVESDFDGAVWGISGTYTTMSHAMLIKVDSSWGVPLSTDYVHWWELFDKINRALLVEHVVPAGNYFLVSARCPMTAQDASVMPLVSLVGWYDGANVCEVSP